MSIEERKYVLNGLPMSEFPEHDLWGVAGSCTLEYEDPWELVQDQVDNREIFGLDENEEAIKSGEIDIVGGDYRYGSLVDHVDGDYCLNLLINIPNHCKTKDNRNVFMACKGITKDMDADVYETFADDFDDSSESVMPSKMINQMTRILYRGVKQFIKEGHNIESNNEVREDQIANTMRRRLVRLFRHRPPFRLNYLSVECEATITVTDGEVTGAKIA